MFKLSLAAYDYDVVIAQLSVYGPIDHVQQDPVVVAFRQYYGKFAHIDEDIAKVDKWHQLV